MALPREHLLDELATAYLQALAAVVGAVISVSRLDYGVDGTLKHIIRSEDGRYIESGFPVDFQLKGTTVAAKDETQIRFDLAARNYDLIVTRSRIATPYFLFLVCFPPSIDAWAVIRPDRLILNASAFWWTDSGEKTTNTASIRVAIPSSNRLTPVSMSDMLESSQGRFV
jgi:Domain of unknown function (DUF4365)